MLFVWFYFVTLLALTIAAQSVLENDVALSSFKKLNFSSKALPMQPSTQCVGLNNGDSFVVRGDCQAYLMCWEGEVFEMWCSGGQLFDPQLLICRPENEVQCTDLQRSCPPAGSNELRFLPSDFCDSFYVCVNGRPAPAFCRTGQHWNDIHQFCDDPWTAGCDSVTVLKIFKLQFLLNLNLFRIKS